MMTTTRMWLVLVLTAVTLVTRPAAQQAPTPQPIFRAGVDYVRIDVVVTDAKDRPIIDLTKDDFEVIERGRRQSIKDFQFVSVPVESRAPQPNAPSPSSDVANNVAPSPQSRVFVMIVDDLHILESDIISVKRVMTEFIAALSKDDEVAVVFVGRSNLSQNFTSDRRLLLRTVDRVRDALGFGLDALGRSSGSNVDPKTMYDFARSADFVLKNVAMSLAGSGQSRRAIVYVTGGSICPSSPGREGLCRSDFEDLRDVYETARRADVPIYTLDPRGQVLPEDAIRGGIGAIMGTAQRSTIAANIKLQQDRLAEVAINTGGRAFTNQSDLRRAVHEIVSENGSFYLLGYYPDPFEADGKFHTFTVNVKRPGVRVRARSGYLASAINSGTADPKPVLDVAMSAGVNVAAISLRAFIAPIATGVKGMKSVVTVEVVYPPRLDASRLIDDEVHMRVVALDPDGRTKASSDQMLRFNGTAADENPVPFLVNDVIELPSQSLTLRIGVASRALGKAGTVQMSVDVPKPFDAGLELSGIAIGVSPAGASVVNAEAIASLVPFQPTASRTFTVRDTLRVFGRAFWRSRDAPVVTIGIKAVSGSLKQPTLTASAGVRGKEAVFDTTVPLAGIAPGSYVLEVTGRSGGAKALTRELAFVVR